MSQRGQPFVFRFSFASQHGKRGRRNIASYEDVGEQNMHTLCWANHGEGLSWAVQGTRVSQEVVSVRPRPTLPYLLIQFASIFLSLDSETLRFEEENGYENEI